MIAFDSNIWIALFHTEDDLHTRARTLIQQFSSRILLPEYVILEVCSVLKIKKQKQAADHFLDIVLDNKDIELLIHSRALLHETLRVFRNEPLSDLSFVDVSLLVLSRLYPVYTFDKKLAAVLKKRGKTGGYS